MILNNNSTQQINTLLIQLQNRITNSTNEFIKLNDKLNNKIDNKIDNLDSKISDLEKNNDYDVSEMNAKIKANTEAISGKADKNHTHIKSEITDFDHTHDDRYYTESEVDTKLSGKADKIHTHTKSQITDFPTSLKNPNALTINGKTYDGSSAVDAGVQTVANGGTGVTTQADINKAFIGNLDTGESDVTDGTEFVSSWASDNGFAETAEGALNTPYKRKFIKVWDYIKDKISSVLGLTKDNYGGKANTAGTADTVDNYHASQLWRSDGANWNPNANVIMTPSGNNSEWSFDFKNKNGATGSYWHVWDEDKSTLLKVNVDDGKVSAPYGFVGNLSGKAAKSSFLDEYVGAGGTRPTSGNIKPKDASEYGGMRKDVVTDSMTDSGRPSADGHLLTMFWDNAGRYDSQFFVSNNNPLTVKVRTKANKTDYGPWTDIITSNNIGSQTVANSDRASTAGTADNARNMHYQSLDLSALDKTKFYPLVCVSGQKFTEVAICSGSGMGSMDYNQNRIHFDISTQGWNDLPATLNIREYACYDNNEIAIGCIGRGTCNGAWAIWLRGGLYYTCFSRDSDLSLHTSNYTYDYEVYTIGTNYYGGSNTHVEIMFTPQSTISEGAYSSRPITASVIKASSKMVIPIGAPSSLKDGCIWIER